VRVVNTNQYRPAPIDPAEAIALAIEMEGPESVAAVFLEPVQNSGGCFPPPEGYFQRVREICDEYGVLLVSDEVICAFGRSADGSARALRLPARHHHDGEGHDVGLLAHRRDDRARP
jgi:adenosylmethionine-8-amino-7-oxononanoate aminotransferase